MFCADAILRLRNEAGCPCGEIGIEPVNPFFIVLSYLLLSKETTCFTKCALLRSCWIHCHLVPKRLFLS